jgi:hypothetical protein
VRGVVPGRAAAQKRDPANIGAEVSNLDTPKPVACTYCGQQLGYSSDDQPDWPTGPICGACHQSNQSDDEELYPLLYEDED